MVTFSDTKIKSARQPQRLLRFFDGHGMYLEVHATGLKFGEHCFHNANGKEAVVRFDLYA